MKGQEFSGMGCLGYFDLDLKLMQHPMHVMKRKVVITAQIMQDTQASN